MIMCSYNVNVYNILIDGGCNVFYWMNLYSEEDTNNKTMNDEEENCDDWNPSVSFLTSLRFLHVNIFDAPISVPSKAFVNTDS